MCYISFRKLWVTVGSCCRCYSLLPRSSSFELIRPFSFSYTHGPRWTISLYHRNAFSSVHVLSSSFSHSSSSSSSSFDLFSPDTTLGASFPHQHRSCSTSFISSSFIAQFSEWRYEMSAVPTWVVNILFIISWNADSKWAVSQINMICLWIPRMWFRVVANISWSRWYN